MLRIYIDSKSVLIYATNNGNVELVKLVIQAGDEMNYGSLRSLTALFDCLNRCSTDIAKLLIESGTNINKY